VLHRAALRRRRARGGAGGRLQRVEVREQLGARGRDRAERALQVVAELQRERLFEVNLGGAAARLL
jgi:hypothetical protein